ncbi:hypothetical protein V1577_02075 [Enterobacter bugandensis]|nr:hypothetical protein [Enterobacter bugandensis]
MNSLLYALIEALRCHRWLGAGFLRHCYLSPVKRQPPRRCAGGR